MSKDDCSLIGTIPLFTSDSNNNGIVGYVDKKPTHIVNKDEYWVIFGDHTRTFNLTNVSFCVADNVKVLKPTKKISRSSLLFINSCWKKQIPNKGYARHWNIAKNIKIQLPVKNGEIDWLFIDNFVAELEAQRVAELEAQRVAELEAHLAVTGLKNYILTEKEQTVLQDFKNNKFEWREFRIGDLFEIKPTKAYKLNNSELFNNNGINPVVTNSSQDNGITGYTKLKPTEKGNIITYSDTTTSDAIFYQPYDFVGYSHIQGLYPKYDKNKWQKPQLLYFVTLFKKVAEGKFSYGHKFNRKIASQMTIKLPVKNGEIDFEIMELLVSAIQKEVIKDVVLYADKKIEATRKVVASE